jgi:hypothetical protein
VVGRIRAENGGMLRAHCPRHGRTVLVATSQIDGIDHTNSTLVVRWHCTCGTPGSTHFPRTRAVV